MNTSRHADDAQHRGSRSLLATATFFGEVVEERFTPAGHVLQIGNSDAMAVPVPEGWPYLARVRWAGNTAKVTDGGGAEHVLGYGDQVTIDAGPVALTLEQVPRYMLRRTGEMQAWGSLAWFTVVYAFTLLTMSGGLAWNMRCQLFPPDLVATAFPECFGGGQTSMVGGRYTAEYLARLLREDYAGSEDGALEPEDRETGERENPSFYLPAGSTGPITEMGGADETASEEIRAPEEAALEDEVHEAELPLVAPEGTGVPIEAAPETSDDDAVAEADDGEDDSTTQPAEDRQGWGVQDWYDSTDEAMEEMEIEYMLRHARERLRIDPEDPDALSILSYYQYLAQDYDAARATYDKFISLYPDESAGYNNKALIYKRKGDYEKEEGLYRVALALRPDDETALNNLAVCLAHQGRTDEALSIMERLETIDPDDPYADLHRAKIYAEMGDDEQALSYLEKALQGMAMLDTLHHIEFRQDIRIDPSFEKLRHSRRFHAILERYYGDDSPLLE